jgi:hypothetical protein
LLPESEMENRGFQVAELVRISCNKPDRDEQWVNDEYVEYRYFVPVKDEVEERCNEIPKRPNQVIFNSLQICSCCGEKFLRSLYCKFIPYLKFGSWVRDWMVWKKNASKVSKVTDFVLQLTIQN